MRQATGPGGAARHKFYGKEDDNDKQQSRECHDRPVDTSIKAPHHRFAAFLSRRMVLARPRFVVGRSKR